MWKLKILIVFIAFLLVFNVNAINQPVYKSGNMSTKKIALTFDDGPHPIKTEKILEILRKHEIKATFFVIGKNIENYPEAFIKVVEEGHEIGNHTYSHSYMNFNLNSKKISDEIEKTENLIKKFCNKNNKILRPPCGLYSDKMVEIAKQRGYKTILWSIDTQDWAHASKDDIVNSVLNRVKGGDIILFHDYTSGENYTLEALNELIPLLKEKGFEIVTVSEILK